MQIRERRIRSPVVDRCPGRMLMVVSERLWIALDLLKIEQSGVKAWQGLGNVSDSVLFFGPQNRRRMSFSTQGSIRKVG